MKKITRKSLDELAEIMPVLSESEQEKSVGGYEYYDASGNFLGSYGPESNMRVVDSPYTFNQLVKENAIADLPLISAPISDAPDSTKKNLIMSLASGMGFKINFFEGPSNKYGEYRPETGIWMNVNSPSFDSGNKYDFMMTLRHEHLHSLQNPLLSVKERERAAYEAAFHHPDFSKTSPSYQENVRTQLAIL